MEPVDDELGNVKRVDGSPVVLSRYGFKKMVFKGETYLTPMTEEELISGLAKMSGETEDAVRAKLKLIPGSCYTMSNGFLCATDDGCAYCRKIYVGGGWSCVCGYD